MKRSLTEKKVLKKLDIPDFRHMTKDKIVKFASLLPRMDPTVAKEAIDQFPQFKEMASELTNILKDMADKAFKSSEDSQKYFYEACMSVIENLHAELDDDLIDIQEREQIRDHILQVLEMMSDKDSEHKDLIRDIVHTTALGVGFVVMGAAAILGGVFLMNAGNSTDEDGNTIEGEFDDTI